MLRSSGVALLLAAWTLYCTGQDTQPPEAPPTDTTPQVMPQARSETKQKAPAGAVTGTVYCADTNTPARLAQIYMLQFSQDSAGQRSNAMSDLDGRFRISHVPEGEYYVVAVLPGYVNLLDSLTKEHLDAMTAEERKKLLAVVPSAKISTDQTATVSVRLERGAEIDGTVLYDDGSPAIGLQVELTLKSPDGDVEDLSITVPDPPTNEASPPGAGEEQEAQPANPQDNHQ